MHRSLFGVFSRGLPVTFLCPTPTSRNRSKTLENDLGVNFFHFRSKFPNTGPFNCRWTISSCKFKDHKDFFIFRKHHFNEVAWFLIQIIARCFSVLAAPLTKVSRTEPERRDSKNGQKWRRNLNFFELFFLVIKWWNVSDILVSFSLRFGNFLTAK